MYTCYLNGNIYGRGSLDYMKELFIEYVITCEMYGKDQCEFVIKKAWDKDREPTGTVFV